MSVRQGGLGFVGFCALASLGTELLGSWSPNRANIYGVFSLDFLLPSFSGRPKDWGRWHRAAGKGSSRCKAAGLLSDPV